MIASSLATLTSWGRATRAPSVVWRPDQVSDLTDIYRDTPRAHGLIPYAAGRAYGDCALNTQGTALLTAPLARILAFDPATGAIQVEPGVTFRQLMTEFLPQGWLPPVCPGTGFATIGGAVANDVHGKNHEVAGSFARHVTALDLLTPDGTSRKLSSTAEPDLFRATCGGLGLTGIITRIAFTMKRVPGPAVAVRTQRYPDLDSYLAAMDEARHATYCVGWIDGTARGRRLGRGILEFGEPIGAGAGAPPAGRLRVPLDFPSWALSPPTITAFNQLYFHRASATGRLAAKRYETYFYPLDALRDWNRIYGTRGFHQFQNVVPFETGPAALRELLEVIAATGRASFLAVLKRLGPNDPQAGPLSFPRAGYTLALDFPAGPGIAELYARLVAITLRHGGRIYLAKDDLLDQASFREMYPRWHEYRDLLAELDPRHRMQSNLSRRLGLRAA